MTNSTKTTNVPPDPKDHKQEKLWNREAKQTEKKQSLPPRSEREPQAAAQIQSLRFSPYAWAKLLFFRDAGDTEIGGFGITPADDLLYVEDFQTVRQQVTCVSVAFDDEAVADFFENQVDQNRKPEQFARIWVHSHPGNSPQPSGTDEDTFQRVFGKCQWSVMAIIAREGKTCARIGFNIGPGAQAILPVVIDYSRPFPAAQPQSWLEEYKANIHPVKWIAEPGKLTGDLTDPFDQQDPWPLENLRYEDNRDFDYLDKPWW